MRQWEREREGEDTQAGGYRDSGKWRLARDNLDREAPSVKDRNGDISIYSLV